MDSAPVENETLRIRNRRAEWMKHDAAALKKLVKVLDEMSPRGRWAGVRWIIERYDIREEPPAADAVDPSADSTGKPPTRD